MNEGRWVRAVGMLAGLATGCACEAPPMPDASAATDAAALADAGGADAGAADDAHPADTSAPTDARAARDSGAITCAAGASFDAYVEVATELGCRFLHECTAARSTRIMSTSCRSDSGALDAYREAIAAGTLRFDGAAACACLAAYGSGCGLDFRIAGIAPCLEIFQPADPEGRCGSTSDCGFGRCVLTAGECPGHCETAFGGPGVGEPCDAAVPCAFGLRCGPAGTCLPLAGLGDPCTSTFDCIYAGGGAWCDARGPGMPGVCRAGRGAGEPCGSMGSASFPQCALPLTCIGGTCGAGASEGEACSATAPCAVRLWCNGGLCAPSRAPGESCSADDDCPMGFACTGSCVPLPRVGEPCLGGRCWVGECVSGECAPRPDGAACDTSAPYARQCEGRCDLTSMTCAALRGAGESCTLATDCADGLTCLESRCRAACAL